MTNATKIFQTGDRVLADYRPGTIVSVRMEAPDYSRPEAYSVRMDHLLSRPDYEGSIWPACDVRPIGGGR